MSVGVVTVAVGSSYQTRLPAWCHAVAALEQPPDAVTIVVDSVGSWLLDQVYGILPHATVLVSDRSWSHHPQVLVNDGIAVTVTDWICKMDVDDVILPHALSPLEAVDADVFMFGILHRGQPLIPQSVTAEVVSQRQSNPVFSGSPFRRAFWIDNPFRDMIFEDWAFWIGCADRGARFVSSGTVDYIYSHHDGQISVRSDAAYWSSVVRSLP